MVQDTLIPSFLQLSFTIYDTGLSLFSTDNTHSQLFFVRSLWPPEKLYRGREAAWYAVSLDKFARQNKAFYPVLPKPLPLCIVKKALEKEIIITHAQWCRLLTHIFNFSTNDHLCFVLFVLVFEHLLCRSVVKKTKVMNCWFLLISNHMQL